MAHVACVASGTYVARGRPGCILVPDSAVYVYVCGIQYNDGCFPSAFILNFNFRLPSYFFLRKEAKLIIFFFLTYVRTYVL